MTMPVECVSEDFSDPEAVSGSSTNIFVSYISSIFISFSYRLKKKNRAYDSFFESKGDIA